MSQTVKDAEPPLAHCGVFLISFFFFFYHPEWDHGSCCKSYRGNKRCLVLNFHAASPEQFPYRRAIRVIPQFKKKKRNKQRGGKKKNSPLCGLLSCQAGLCAIDSHSVVFSDAKRRRGGGGGWGRVGWVGGGVWMKGGVAGVGVRNRLGEPITTQRWRK